MIIHFDETKTVALEAISTINLTKPCYVIRDVYGRISVYVESETETEPLVDKIRKALIHALGEVWFGDVESMSSDSFFLLALKSEELETIASISEHLFFSERHLTRLNWFRTPKQKSSWDNPKTKVITFYSFKGGVGRTTALALTALWLVRLGRKVVLVDFDLEAPGLASLLMPENNSYPRYGVIDYLLESHIYQNSEETLSFSEYLYPFQDKELTGTKGGQLYIMQAANFSSTNMENYVEKIARIDFGTPAYATEINPVYLLLNGVSDTFKPDYIFIDARTGMNDIGGLTLTRFSDMGVLLFYGNEQNYAGMKFVLPRVMKSRKPFLLVNSPVPPDYEQNEEENYFIEKAYDIFVQNEYYQDNPPDMYQKGAEHFPLSIPYDPQATLLNSVKKLKNLLDKDGKESNPYYQLAERIMISSEEDQTNRDISYQERNEILNTIIGISSKVPAAENEFSNPDDLRRNFFPLKDHKFIFDSNMFLILGPKGSGKTALFLMLEQPEYARELARFAEVSSESIQNTKWITGLKKKPEYPSKTNFNEIGSEDDPLIYSTYWQCLIIKVLHPKYCNLLPGNDTIQTIAMASFQELRDLAKNPKLGSQIEDYLAKLEQILAKANESVIIIYDALDVLLAQSYRGKLIAALISLWFEYQSRYKHIRAKIFLRNDIFDNELTNITDKIKLKNYTANLAWEYDSLLAMVWKRMVERSDNIKELFNKSLVSLGFSMVKFSEIIGYIPKAAPESNKALIKAVFGEKMGGGNKGATYNWIKNHLSDARTQIVPRSILSLFQRAAEAELNTPFERASLIRPKKLQEVLPDVSKDRVTELAEEYSDYASVFSNLRNHHDLFPATEENFKAALLKCGIREDEVSQVIRDLIQIGVISFHQKSRNDAVTYHFPDIYLYGMGLSRKGPK